MEHTTCRVCLAEGNFETFPAKELMYETMEEFKYFKCPQCDCVQIKEIPQNIGQYYPANYYSFASKTNSLAKRFAFYIKASWFKYSIGSWNPIGFFMTMLFKKQQLASLILKMNISKNDSIVDIGCGQGKLIQEMKFSGFHNVEGADPHIAETMNINNVKIQKLEIEDLQSQFDFIMMHHSLEHVDDQQKVFSNLNRLLKENGKILIRVPLSDSFAYNKYKTNWVQFDAPRHLYLHTKKSMQSIVEKHGMKIENVIYDSNGIQLWGSEQNENGISVYSKRSKYQSPWYFLINRRGIGSSEKTAQKLNKLQDGDQACFIISKN